jgi:hypothetical protein
MVTGLLTALGKRYGITDLMINHIGKNEDQTAERFVVEWR